MLEIILVAYIQLIARTGLGWTGHSAFERKWRAGRWIKGWLSSVEGWDVVLITVASLVPLVGSAVVCVFWAMLLESCRQFLLLSKIMLKYRRYKGKICQGKTKQAPFLI